MPFMNGTAKSPSDLMNQINTFVTANGWTKLRGETDQVPASPKAARYWRVLMTEQESTGDDFFRIDELELRETVAGANVAVTPANWSASSDNGNPPANLTGAGIWVSQDIDNEGFAWVEYDFGSAQIIREASMTCGQDAQAPTRFHIQWSHDRLTWCTMWEALETFGWLDGETKVFSFDDGYIENQHVDALIKRTSGLASQPTFDGLREDDWFVWQGPGYDPARRVYVGMNSDYTLTTGSHYLTLRGYTGWTGAEVDQGQEEGADTVDQPKLIFTSGTVDFWLYVNSIRMILITKNSVSDYTSAYLGFGAAFAQPDDWGFPLFIGATADGFDSIADTGNEQSMFCDPGPNGAARVRLWDNTWQTIVNRAESSVDNLIFTGSDYSVHPWSPGSGVGDGNFPYCQWGDNDTGGSHILDNMDPTLQNDLPVFSAIVQSRIYGNLMALDGIFAIPGGGLISPEQVINIGGQDYRVFPNRSRRDGNSFFLVRED